MDNKEQILNALYDKMSNEFEEFLELFLQMSPSEIIYKQVAYELVYKQDILSCFGDFELQLSNKNLLRLLELDNPLDWLYKTWLNTDGSHMSMLLDFIKCAELRL